MKRTVVVRAVVLIFLMGSITGCESTDDSEAEEGSTSDEITNPGANTSETDMGAGTNDDQSTSDDDGQIDENVPGGPLNTQGVQVTGLMTAQSAPPGLDDAIVSRIETVSANESGRVVVSAVFTVSDGPGSGVWSGDVTGLTPVLTTVDRFPGTPNNVRIDTLTGGNVGSDGSIAFVVGFGGAQTNSSLVLQPDPSSALTTVVSTGQTITGFGAPVTIRSIGEARPIGQAVSVRINPGQLLEEGLHLWDGSEMQPIAPLSFSASFPGTPILESTGCGITVGPVLQQDRHELLNDGRVVFEAQLINSPTVFTCQASAVMVYDNGSYNAIVTSGEPVPGAPEAVFNEVRIHEVLENSDMVIRPDWRKGKISYV